MRVGITGASGFIGAALTRALLERGDSVTAFTRRRQSVISALPGAEPYPWPPDGQFPLLDAVVHLAGEPVSGRWTAEKRAAIRDTRVAGTRTLVEAVSASPHRPDILLCASAIGFYGDRGDEELTEASPGGSGFLAEVCRAWEEEALGAERLGLRVAMLRTGIVLAGDGGALLQMLPLYHWGLGGPLGTGRQWFSWVHRDDVVRLYLWLLDNDVCGPVNGTAPHPVRQREFARELGRTVGRPALLPTPHLALKLMYGGFANTLFDSQCVLPAVAQSRGFRFLHPEIGGALAASLNTIPVRGG